MGRQGLRLAKRPFSTQQLTLEMAFLRKRCHLFLSLLQSLSKFNKKVDGGRGAGRIDIYNLSQITA